MWDQNPLLHQLYIADLARDREGERARGSDETRAHRVAGIAATLTAVAVAVLVLGVNAA